MQVKKRLDTGLTARELTAAEFFACVDYAVSNGRQYPLDEIGLKPDAVEQHSVPGYNALLDAGVFEIDEEGYPSLTVNVPDMTDFILALDGMESLLSIRLALGKRSLMFYYFHTDSEWAIIWRSGKTAWDVVAGTYTTPPAPTIVELASSTLMQAPATHVGVRFSFYSMTGDLLASTEIVSAKDIGFIEQKPSAPALASDVEDDDWPQIYSGLGSMIARAASILKVM